MSTRAHPLAKNLIEVPQGFIRTACWGALRAHNQLWEMGLERNVGSIGSGAVTQLLHHE
jgi:hypothetical protein